MLCNINTVYDFSFRLIFCNQCSFKCSNTFFFFNFFAQCSFLNIISFSRNHFMSHMYALGFPGGSVVKKLPANEGDMDSISELAKSPGKGNGNQHQYSCLGNPMDRRSLRTYSPWDCERVRHNLVTKQWQRVWFGSLFVCLQIWVMDVKISMP